MAPKRKPKASSGMLSLVLKEAPDAPDAKAPKLGPADLVALVYELTTVAADEKLRRESEDARMLVAHVALAIHQDDPAVWARVAKARAVFEPKLSRRATMAAGRKAMERILSDWWAGTANDDWWIKGSLEISTRQSAFAALEHEALKAMFIGLRSNPAQGGKGKGGRTKDGKGNRTSAVSALAFLACSCGAWGFKPGDQEKARRLIGRAR